MAATLLALRRAAVPLAAAALAGGCGSSARHADHDPGALDLRVPRARLAQPDVAFHVYERMSDAWTRGGATEEQVLAAATRGQRAVYVLEDVDGEIGNGGFDQLFWNSTGDFTRDAIAAARLVGARPQERLLRRAASIFPGGLPPRDRSRRQDQLDALPAARTEAFLGTLDDRWYAADRVLAARLDAYVRAHPRDFVR
jgi:hypothetical protein